MQIGGLGLITMSLFFMSLFVELGLATQLMAGQILEINVRKNLRDLLFFTTFVTLVVEAVGAILIGLSMAGNGMTPGELVFFSVFHSISSFCNAGISVFPASLEPFATNTWFVVITTILMIIGGLGFITLHELMQYYEHRNEKKWYALSLQSKIILYGTVMVTSVTAILFYLIERTTFFQETTYFETIVQSIFYAVSFRSTGFLLSSLYLMHAATWMIIMVVAFIGVAPGSTGSGVKLTTVTIVMMIIRTVFLKKSSVEIQGRRLATEQVFKAVAIIALSIMWILFTTFCLLLTESSWQFFDILFEVCSAVNSLGISTGITPHLSIIGKILIITSMLIGRVGSVSFILALRLKNESPGTPFAYPEEHIMLG